MRANPEGLTESLLEVKEQMEKTPLLFTHDSRRGVDYFNSPDNSIVWHEEKSMRSRQSIRISPKFVDRQEEMRKAAVRTMVASGTAKSLRDDYQEVEGMHNEGGSW